jgi:hypothetical protein
MTAYAVGVALAAGAGLFAHWLGLDRERGFYPTVLTVIAFLYSLFAVMGGSNEALLQELAAGLVFVALVVIGFRRSLWWVAAGLALHGVFDFFHPHLIADPGVPPWWPAFCLAYDLVAAAGLAWLIRRGTIRA